jgi:hypothetical protein
MVKGSENGRSKSSALEVIDMADRIVSYEPSSNVIYDQFLFMFADETLRLI